MIEVFKFYYLKIYVITKLVIMGIYTNGRSFGTKTNFISLFKSTNIDDTLILYDNVSLYIYFFQVLVAIIIILIMLGKIPNRKLKQKNCIIAYT